MPYRPNSIEGLRFRIVLKPGFAIGPGKADLLEAIADTESLTAAAARFDMSYKRAWSLVQEMNRAFETPLVVTGKGGSGGGGKAMLSPLGQKVLARYRKMEAAANKAIAGGVADMKRHLRKDKAPK
jgi:molybdate transport system regulatory protein